MNILDIYSIPQATIIHLFGASEIDKWTEKATVEINLTRTLRGQIKFSEADASKDGDTRM